MADDAHRIAVVGAGPSGFYVVEHLLRHDPAAEIDLYDRLPTPFGLVRGGVAPDHPKIKTVSAVFDRIARDPRVRFFGHVEVRTAVTVHALQWHYHATVFATGAWSSTHLNIPGAQLPGVVPAMDFVGWYNGVPDHSGLVFDLQCEEAAVIGHGNVAADICRMLLTPIDELAKTDIAQHALEQLAQSRVRHVQLIGRRGSAQSKFSSNELRELGDIGGCDIVVRADELGLNEACVLELAEVSATAARKNQELLQQFAQVRRRHPRSLSLRFLWSPAEVLGSERVEGLRLVRNELVGPPFAQTAQATTETLDLRCGLVFESVGFHGVPIPGLPFDQRRGVAANAAGRVVGSADEVHDGLYVAGWIKRGPTGIIGANRADGIETARQVLADLPRLAGRPVGGRDAVSAWLRQSGVRATDYSDWLHLDQLEQSLGTRVGKPREKLVRVDAMLQAIDCKPGEPSP